MICKKCGCHVDRSAKECFFCGEPLEPGDSDLIDRTIGKDKGAPYRENLPPLLPLKKLAPVPGTPEETIAELRRLKDYFRAQKGSYALLRDLKMLAEHINPPSPYRWFVVGGLVALLLYVVVGVKLPHEYASLFFIVWGIVTVTGYVRSGRSYEHRRARSVYDIRLAQNDIRSYFNAAENCFLPLAFTEPTLIEEMLEKLDAGLISSFEEFRSERTMFAQLDADDPDGAARE